MCAEADGQAEKGKGPAVKVSLLSLRPERRFSSSTVQGASRITDSCRQRKAAQMALLQREPKGRLQQWTTCLASQKMSHQSPQRIHQQLRQPRETRLPLVKGPLQRRRASPKQRLQRRPRPMERLTRQQEQPRRRGRCLTCQGRHGTILQRCVSSLGLNHTLQFDHCCTEDDNGSSDSSSHKITGSSVEAWCTACRRTLLESSTCL